MAAAADPYNEKPARPVCQPPTAPSESEVHVTEPAHQHPTGTAYPPPYTNLPAGFPNPVAKDYPPNPGAPGYPPNSGAPGYPPNPGAPGYPPNSGAPSYPPNSGAPGYPPNLGAPGYPPNPGAPGYPPNPGAPGCLENPGTFIHHRNPEAPTHPANPETSGYPPNMQPGFSQNTGAPDAQPVSFQTGHEKNLTSQGYINNLAAHGSIDNLAAHGSLGNWTKPVYPETPGARGYTQNPEVVVGYQASTGTPSYRMTQAAAIPAPPVVVQKMPLAGPPNDYFSFSIITTVGCFFVLGLVALYQSMRVRQAVRDGNAAVAKQASRLAKLLNISAVVTGVILFILIIVASSV